MRTSQTFAAEAPAELSPQQLAVIAAIVAGHTVVDAARHVDVDRRTFYNWLKDDRFKAELNRAKRENLERLKSQLRTLGQAAVTAFREIVTGEKPPDQARAEVAHWILQSIGALDRSDGDYSEGKIVLKDLTWKKPLPEEEHYENR